MKNKIFYIIVIVVLLLSCSQNSLEVITTSYEKDGMYCLSYVDIYNRIMKLQYASMDSLEHFKDTGLTLALGSASIPHLLYNDENKLLLIGTTEYLYFVDSETHKIKKIMEFLDENNDPEPNRVFSVKIFSFNNKYCYYQREQIIYRIDLKEMTSEIAFDFRGNDYNYYTFSAPNGRYLY